MLSNRPKTLIFSVIEKSPTIPPGKYWIKLRRKFSKHPIWKSKNGVECWLQSPLFPTKHQENIMKSIYNNIFLDISKGVTNEFIDEIRNGMYAPYSPYSRKEKAAWLGPGQKLEDVLPKVKKFTKEPKHITVDSFIETQKAEIIATSQAVYALRSDLIGMPEPEDFINLEEYYRTFFHELAHWTDHEERLPRNSVNGAEEETIAEISSALLCNIFNIHPWKNRHIEYIAIALAKENLRSPIPESYFKTAIKIVEYLLFLPKIEIARKKGQ